jgi:monoterpene epsilon-lactone hydrolase
MRSLQSCATKWTVKNLSAPIFNADTPIRKQRKRLDKLMGIPPLPRGVSARALTICDLSALWIDVNEKTQRTLLFLHGGAYNIGSIDSHKELAAQLGIAAKANVLLIDYGLAPENAFPAGLNDAEMAYQWLLRQGYKASSITIAGDSAGGGLALALAMKLRDSNVPLPACLCLISPWTDLTMSGESIRVNATKDIMLNPAWMRQLAHNYAGPDHLANPLVSPHYGEYKGLPPIIVQVGADELVLSDSERMASKAKESGVDISLEVNPDMWHVWHVHAAYMPEAKKALKKLGRFIISHSEDNV